MNYTAVVSSDWNPPTYILLTLQILLILERIVYNLTKRVKTFKCSNCIEVEATPEA